jgi:hypothetical protein
VALGDGYSQRYSPRSPRRSRVASAGCRSGSRSSVHEARAGWRAGSGLRRRQDRPAIRGPGRCRGRTLASAEVMVGCRGNLDRSRVHEEIRCTMTEMGG